jgi:CRISPR/Cas system CMR-associated protein Cmr5 small subunit
MLPDESRYGQGYRDALTQTIEHVNNRIAEEKRWSDEYHDTTEFLAYTRALSDVKKYLEWLVKTIDK